MSLFSFGGGGGDIWSSAGFAFVSPINDILDKDSFTLEEILAQDEVLQEVKSLNTKLVDFLCKETSILEMMAFIAEPPPEGGSDNRIFKFPYMSCEIICCEVPHILDAVANERSSAPLAKLFSMLNEEGDMDSHHAGYLEKVLIVLLRHRCGPTTEFLNAGGVTLFRKMVQHLGNFSVMQVAKLLLLPKYAALQDIDAASLMADGRGADGSDLSATLSVWCNWSDDPEILQILLREFKGIGARVIGDSVSNDTETSVPGAAASVAKGKEREEAAGNEGAEGVAGASVGNEGQGVAAEGARDRSDLHMHLSELLLALITQCSPESSFLKRMFSREAIEPLVAAATLSKEQGREAKGSQAALQILAALADRFVRPQPPAPLSLIHGASDMQVDTMENLGGSHSPPRGGNGGRDGDEGCQGSEGEGGRLGFEGIRRELQNVDGELLERGLRELVPSLCAYLRGHKEDPSMIWVQIRREQPRLGSLRLQVVRFVETLVRMDSRAIDQALMAENAMATCLEMMFTYESSSMLHASVSSAVLDILGMSPPPLPPLGVNEAFAAAAAEQAAEAARRAAYSGWREPFQRHLFEDCHLAERILEAVAFNEDAEKGPNAGGSPSAPILSSSLPSSPPAVATTDGSGTSDQIESAMATSSTAAGAAGASTSEQEDSIPSGPGMSPSLDETKPTATAPAAAAPTPGGAEGGVGQGGELHRGQGEGVPAGGVTGEASEDGDNSLATKRRQRSRHGRRLGHMGHVLLLSKAIMEAQNMEPRPGLVDEEEIVAGAGGRGGGVRGDPTGVSDGVNDSNSGGAQVGGGGDGEGGGAMGGPAATARKSFVAGLLSRRDCSEQWQEYISTTLAQELSRQLNPLGGFVVPSRDEENQLSTDFPDEAVDMDDTTGLLENIARLQNPPGMPGAAPGGGVVGSTAQGGKMIVADSLDLDDDDDDFEGMDSVVASSRVAVGTLSDNNPNLTMMFGSGNFMSSGGNGWGSITGTTGGGSSVGDASAVGSSTNDSPVVNEGWANFADFGDPQQPSTPAAIPGSSLAGGSASSAASGTGASGFPTFDPVFSIDSSPAPTTAVGGMLAGGTGVRVADPGPGPNAYAPSPPAWGSSAGSSSSGGSGGGGAGGAVAESGGGGNASVGSGMGTFNSTAGGSGTGGFGDFSQYRGFGDFSAMMEDVPPTPPVPPLPSTSPPLAGGGPGNTTSTSQAQEGHASGLMNTPTEPQAFPQGGSGAGTHADDDRMDDDTEEGDHDAGSGVPGADGAGAPGVTDNTASAMSPRREPMDGLEAMVGSDD